MIRNSEVPEFAEIGLSFLRNVKYELRFLCSFNYVMFTNFLVIILFMASISANKALKYAVDNGKYKSNQKLQIYNCDLSNSAKNYTEKFEPHLKLVFQKNICNQESVLKRHKTECKRENLCKKHKRRRRRHITNFGNKYYRSHENFLRLKPWETTKKTVPRDNSIRTFKRTFPEENSVRDLSKIFSGGNKPLARNYLVKSFKSVKTSHLKNDSKIDHVYENKSITVFPHPMSIPRLSSNNKLLHTNLQVFPTSISNRIFKNKRHKSFRSVFKKNSRSNDFLSIKKNPAENSKSVKNFKVKHSKKPDTPYNVQNTQKVSSNSNERNRFHTKPTLRPESRNLHRFTLKYDSNKVRGRSWVDNFFRNRRKEDKYFSTRRGKSFSKNLKRDLKRLEKCFICPKKQIVYSNKGLDWVPLYILKPNYVCSRNLVSYYTKSYPLSLKSGYPLKAGHYHINISIFDVNVKNVPIKNCVYDFSVRVPKCSTLPYEPHGAVNCTLESIWGSVCQWTCDRDYSVSESAFIKCDGTKFYPTWSRQFPTCQKKDCPAIQSPENGRLVCSTDQHNNVICKVTCSHGYRLAPRLGMSSYVYCKKGYLLWNFQRYAGEALPKCVLR